MARKECPTQGICSTVSAVFCVCVCVVQVSLDRENMEVRVRAGTSLRELNSYLHDEGLAMKNLGSISEQTVAGAISTGNLPYGMKYIGGEFNLADWQMCERITKLNSVNDVCMFVCVKFSIDIGPPNVMCVCLRP